MKAIFFDLDNTLYDVSKYNRRAFESISIFLSEKTGMDKNLILSKLTDNWKIKTSMYPNLFDDVLDQLNIKNNIQQIVKIFNTQIIKDEDIYDDALSIFKKIKKKYKLGIITDGNIERQQNKIKKFNMEDILDTVVYTKNFAPKPSPLAFEYAIKQLDIDPTKTYYVGDNPRIDFMGAKKIGMNTIRIFRGEFIDYPSENYVDNNIDNMMDILEIINN